MTLAAASEPALAQPPDTVTCPEAIAPIAACYTTKLDTGAYLLAAVPGAGTETWLSSRMAGRVRFNLVRAMAWGVSADMAWRWGFASWNLSTSSEWAFTHSWMCCLPDKLRWD